MVTNVIAFRCHAKPPVSRSDGRSVVNAAAYIARENLKDEHLNKVFYYGSKSDDVLFKGIFAPKNVPEWAHDREKLWNEVERVESRKNSQFARVLELAFPHQISDQQREFILKDFVRENFVRQGMIADCAIHAPDKEGDQRNYHAHLLLTLRRINEEGFETHKERDWNKKENLALWREDFALKCSKMLDRAGFTEEAERWKHGHLNLAGQRDEALKRGDVEYAAACEHEATRHKGQAKTSLERRGVTIDQTDPRRNNAKTMAVVRGLVKADSTSQLTADHAKIVQAIHDEEEQEKVRTSSHVPYSEGGMVAQQRDALNEHIRNLKNRDKKAEQERREKAEIWAEMNPTGKALSDKEHEKLSQAVDRMWNQQQQEKSERSHEHKDQGHEVSGHHNKKGGRERD